MRSADIKADRETVYAYAQSWEWRNSRAKPVVVSATRVKRPYRSTADGVRIHYLKGDLTADGDRSGMVPAAHIRELWETYKPRADEQERRRAEEKAQADAEHKANVNRLDTVFESMDVERPKWTHGISEWGTRTDRGQVSLGQLADLLEAAYWGGVKDESR